jgi:putative ABC transport system permease protein
MLQELRFAIRMLIKRPGFSLIAALTLALGIGATSAVFSLIQGVLLTPPPYQKPEQLMLIPTVRADGAEDGQPARLAGATVDGLAEGSEILRRNRCI